MTTTTMVPVFAALGDETRWSVLVALGEGEGKASAHAGRRPVVPPGLAQHHAGLEVVGVVGAQLRDTASRLDAIGAEWDRRLATIRDIAEGR